MDTDIIALNQLVQSLQAENVKLKAMVLDYEEGFPKKVSNLLSNIFSEHQIEMLLNPKKKVAKWSCDDIASAMTLRSISPKAYRYMHDKLKYPIPGNNTIFVLTINNNDRFEFNLKGLSTLRRWASTFSLEPGILENVLKLMKTKGNILIYNH